MEVRPDRPLRWPAYVARDTAHALQISGAVEGCGPRADLTYLPPSWGSTATRRSKVLAGRGAADA